LLHFAAQVEWVQKQLADQPKTDYNPPDDAPFAEQPTPVCTLHPLMYVLGR